MLMFSLAQIQMVTYSTGTHSSLLCPLKGPISNSNLIAIRTLSAQVLVFIPSSNKSKQSLSKKGLIPGLGWRGDV